MDNCLIYKYRYNKGEGFLPLKVGDEAVLAIRVARLLDRTEVNKLMEYADLALAKLDDNRRKKLAIVRNKKAAKRLCSRIKLNEIMFNGKIYQFSDYCERIEIVRWLGNKCVSDKPYHSMVGDMYGKNEDMVMTCVVGLEPPDASSKLSIIDQDEETRIRISEYISLMYCENTLYLKEEISRYNHTQIYFHMIYKPKITLVE